MSDRDRYEEDSEVDLEEEDIHSSEYNDSPAPVPTSVANKAINEWNVFKAKSWREANDDGTMRTIIKATRSSYVRNLINLDGEKFDFTGREYLQPIYDRNDGEVLLKTARQVEKCCTLNTVVALKDGKEIPIANLKAGDEIIALGEGGRQVTDVVIASESNGDKPCVRIKTRLGSVLEVTLNHPLKTLNHWVQAGALKVGDKIASLRTIGAFGTTRESRAGLLGLHIGDGHYYQSGDGFALGFTQKTAEVQDWYTTLALASGESVRTHLDMRSGTTKFALSSCGSVASWLDALGLKNKHSGGKFIPDEAFSWDRESTRDLIRGLWATDGHCKNVTDSKVDLVYCTTSPVLARQIRLLLRKFGIVTVIRENRPNNKNAELAFIIRVVTRRSIEAFHREIGPIPGKPFSVPLCQSNSNLDTLPKEIHEIIVESRKSSGSYWKRDGFQSAGLRINRAYCPTFEKIAAMNEELKDLRIQEILDSDIIWDEIVSIEDMGVQPTWGIQTGTQTFISDFVVNHNTTYLANNLVVTSVVMPFNKSLYVSPSHTQTRQFSSEKLKPAIEKSPLIRQYFQDSSVSTQVFEKGFTNGSYIFLRSAFRTADRARGVSARSLCLDELQDFLLDTIPVIRECTSHFHDARVLYAGTPKSLNNPIEVLWKETTQNEWLVPCKACRKWNFLDERNIAPTEWYVNKRLPPGPVCKYCGKPIHVPDGRWFSTATERKQIQGYRIPQIMVPWICGTYGQWLKLLWKRDNYPISQFYNEVLGISYDSASSPITQEELVQLCGNYDLWDLDRLTSDQINFAKGQSLSAGVDWGEGIDGSEKSPSGKIRSASYSVLTIGYYETKTRYKVVAIKKFTGKETDPDFVVGYIARVCQTLAVQLVGVDWGHGWGVNNTLVRLLGPKRVVQFQYLPKLKQKLKWDPIGFRYHLQRNFLMSEFYYDMKQGYLAFPKWTQFEPFSKDVLAIYTEYNEFRREIKYDHRHSEPDDFFHSCLFAKLTADIFLGNTRRFTRIVDGDNE